MTQHTSDDAPFVFLDYDVSDLDRHATAIADIYRGDLTGMIIRNVYPADSVAAVTARLQRDDPPMQKTVFTKSRHLDNPPHVIGRALVSCSSELDDYFDDARRFRRDCRELFRDQPDFEARMEEIFCILSGGQPVHIAPGPASDSYTPATIRVLPEGHGIRAHVGNRFFSAPALEHISSLVDASCQISYFLTLSCAPRGGELMVYALTWREVSAGQADGAYPIERDDLTLQGSAVDFVRSHRSLALNPGPGDLLIFDGGNYYHEVMAPERDLRRTIGGFLAYSKDHDRVYYWG